MINRRTIWQLFLFIAVFTAGYLYYVKKERQDSVRKYISQPQVGDIYKMKKDTRRDGVEVVYLKIKDIGEQSIYFSPSHMAALAVDDGLLKHFDTTETEVYSKKELAEIAAGKWNTATKDKTELIEIERK